MKINTKTAQQFLDALNDYQQQRLGYCCDYS